MKNIPSNIKQRKKFKTVSTNFYQNFFRSRGKRNFNSIFIFIWEINPKENSRTEWYSANWIFETFDDRKIIENKAGNLEETSSGIFPWIRKLFYIAHSSNSCFYTSFVHQVRETRKCLAGFSTPGRDEFCDRRLNPLYRGIITAKNIGRVGSTAKLQKSGRPIYPKWKTARLDTTPCISR